MGSGGELGGDNPRCLFGVPVAGKAGSAYGVVASPLHARVRGVRAEPAVGRCRASIELANTILRRGVDLYTEGTWATYREAVRDEYPRTFTRADSDTGRQRYFMGPEHRTRFPPFTTRRWLVRCIDSLAISTSRFAAPGTRSA
jgi:hypothetical protein